MSLFPLDGMPLKSPLPQWRRAAWPVRCTRQSLQPQGWPRARSPHWDGGGGGAFPPAPPKSPLVLRPGEKARRLNGKAESCHEFGGEGHEKASLCPPERQRNLSKLWTPAGPLPGKRRHRKAPQRKQETCPFQLPSTAFLLPTAPSILWCCGPTSVHI